MRLGRGELEAAAGAARFHGPEIEREVGETQHVDGLRVHGAAEQRAQSREQLLERERLRQIVVGPGVQPVDTVADRVSRRQQQDRDAISLATQAPRHVEPVVARHHDVEHDRVRRALCNRAEGGVAVRG